MEKILCVVGPTASGKTALAVRLAAALSGEVVSADSMQIYRKMNIGTAKPTEEEKAGIPHHMLDIVNPGAPYSVAQYVADASACVGGIVKRGNLPVVAGGTGLYVDSLVAGLDFAQTAPEEDNSIRLRLMREAEEEGGARRLMARLSKVDPESAARLHENDLRRVIRALEVFERTGRTISQHHAETQKRPPRYDAVYIGLCTEPREILYERIDRRVDGMMAAGLEEEVYCLLVTGALTGTAAQAIGYKELADSFAGKCTRGEAAGEIKKRSRNYAKRQLTWFRRNPNIWWVTLNKSEDLDRVAELSINYAKRRGVR